MSKCGSTLWMAPQKGGKDMPIDSVIQSVRQSQIRQLPLPLSRSHCVKAETFTRFVRDRRNAGFRAICVSAPSTMARWWEMESYRVESSFSLLLSLLPLQSLKPGEPVDRNLWRTSFFKIEALVSHSRTDGAELFILNLKDRHKRP